MAVEAVKRALLNWWNDVVAAMPVVQAVNAVRPGRERGAVTLAAIISLYVTLAFATPHVDALSRRLIASSHMRPTSLASWVLLQPAPKMYGFANRVWRGPFLLVDEEKRAQEARFERGSFWVNHYPARMARYDGERGRVFARPGRTVFVMMRSRFRGNTMWSAIKVREADGALELEAVEVVAP